MKNAGVLFPPPPSPARHFIPPPGTRAPPRTSAGDPTRLRQGSAAYRRFPPPPPPPHTARILSPIRGRCPRAFRRRCIATVASVTSSTNPSRSTAGIGRFKGRHRHAAVSAQAPLTRATCGPREEDCGAHHAVFRRHAASRTGALPHVPSARGIPHRCPAACPVRHPQGMQDPRRLGKIRRCFRPGSGGRPERRRSSGSPVPCFRRRLCRNLIVSHAPDCIPAVPACPSPQVTVRHIAGGPSFLRGCFSVLCDSKRCRCVAIPDWPAAPPAVKALDGFQIPQGPFDAATWSAPPPRLQKGIRR